MSFSYPLRVLLVSLSLALATGAALLWSPQGSSVRIVTKDPSGLDVPAQSMISITFAHPMNRRSLEQHLEIEPAVPGRLSWREQTAFFQPTAPLRPATTYTVTLGAGLSDARGVAATQAISWSFRTRAPQLLYLEQQAGRGSRLLKAQADGSAPQVVLANAGDIRDLAASPATGQLAYTVQREQQRSAIWLLDLASGAQRPLVDDATLSASTPAWSSDGSTIAFERRNLVPQSGTLGPPHVSLAQPDGTLLGPIAHGDTVTFAPSWSPGARYLALVDGNAEAQATYDAASVRKAFAKSAGEAASWSPDGTTFVYAAIEDEATRKQALQLATPANAKATLLAGSEDAQSPAWSPDGRWIAFARRSSEGGMAVWLLPASGGQARQLTRPGANQDLLPVWSPDSQSLVFTRINASSSQVSQSIWTVDLAGTMRQLVDNATNPVWVL